MGRLLDMEEIIRRAKSEYPEEDVRKIAWLLCHTPTAYDVEKVVSQIHSKSWVVTSGNLFKTSTASIGVRIAEDIIRKGGIE